jgi:cell wall-associated NlpC family hydrolase
MTSPGEEIIRRARSLVGTPFRPQGRDPTIGLDCVGLILCVFGIPADSVPGDYRMRGQHRRLIQAKLEPWFGPVAQVERGDVLLCSVSRDQLHLAISCGRSFVHADARFRRIVEVPGAPRWPVDGIFRSLVQI